MLLLQLANIIVRLAELYSLALGLYALLSWFPGGYDSGLGRFLGKICEPYLGIFDRFNLNIGGIGFTIIVAIFVLNMGSQIIARILVGIARMIVF